MNSTRPRCFGSLAAGIGCVALIFAFSRCGWSQEPDPRAQIEELQQKRVAVLEELHDLLFRKYSIRRPEFDLILSEERELLTARLAVAQNREDRIKACDAAVDAAENNLKIVEKYYAAARYTKISVLASRSFLLEAQIERQKEEKAPQIKDLQHQRVGVLEEACAGVIVLNKNARVERNTVFALERELLTARLAVAENRQDRIKACDAAIADAEDLLKTQEGFVAARRVSKAGTLAAKSFLLEAQIERQKAEETPAVAELQRQRVTVLEEMSDWLIKMNKNARLETEAVLSAERDLLAARLGIAQNRQERIKACDAAVHDAERILETQEELFKAARFNRNVVDAAKSLLLESQIERQKAEISE